jgi:hypothetical protein
MSKKQQLQITLSPEATEEYLNWTRAKVEAEVCAGCEPSDKEINILIAASNCYPSEAYVLENGEYIEFGDTDVQLLDV